jgi:hypothetical protein
MTSPASVGSVSIEIVGEVKGLAKKLRKGIEDALKGVDVDKLLRESVGRSKPLKVPVSPEFDTNAIPEKVKKTRVPKVPVEVDPLLNAFQQQVRRQVAALSRSLNANVPVGADTTGLRAQLGAELAEVQRRSRLEVPTEPEGKAAYEAKLKAQLAAVAARVRQQVRVEPDVRGGAGGGFFRALSAGLRGLTSGGPSLSGLITGAADLASGLQKVASTGAAAGGSVSGAFSAAAGPIGVAISLLVGIGAALAAATVAAFAFGPAIGIVTAGLSAAAGAAAAIPAALAGAGAVFGTLSLGFKGIGDAFKPSTGGGGGGGGADPAQRARQIAGAERGVEAARRGIAAATRALQNSERGLVDAERNVGRAEQDVADAQKRALLAQQAISRARREAAEDIDDLNRSLRGAAISEREATRAVADAEFALNEAKIGGDLKEIDRAQNAYDRAVLSLEEAKDTTEDLGEAAKDANAKGVEGSDKVQQALAGQQDALRGVTDAQEGLRKAQEGVLDAQNAVLAANDGLKASFDGLASAQDSLAQAQTKMASGSAGVAKEVTKLAPAAQRFVDAVKALKPAFEGLRLDVQQRLFQGLDKTVTKLGEAWIPALRITLGRYADTFNGFFQNLGVSVTKPKFIEDLQVGAEGARKGLERIGTSITNSLVPAFGTLSRAAGPFLEKVGVAIGGVVDDFGRWVDKAEKSGALKDFFDRAAVAFKDLLETGKQALRIIGGIFTILTGKDDKYSGGETELQKFNVQLRKLGDWLRDPATKTKIRDFINDLKEIAEKFTTAGDKASGLLDKFRGVRSMLFGNTPKKAAVDDQTGINMGGAPVKDDDASTQTYTLGQDIGAALVLGFMAGMTAQIQLQEDIFASLIWKGPNSLIGKIKSGLGIKSPSTVMMDIGYDMIDGLIEGIGQKFGELVERARQIKDRIFTGIGDLAGRMRERAGIALTNFINGVAERFGQLRERAGQIKTQVLAGIGNAALWLYNHGYNAVVGLWNGISSLGGWLWNKVVNFVSSNVGKAVSWALDLGSPSRLTFGYGQFVSQGLALGILADSGEVKAAADEIATLAIPDMSAASLDLAMDGAASVAASLQASSAQRIELSVKPGASADPFLRALADLINLQHNGDVQRALTAR